MTRLSKHHLLVALLTCAASFRAAPPRLPRLPRLQAAAATDDALVDAALVRNFCIIAHIDHGKSTLADRLIEYCGAVEQREMKAQLLDSMDLERERGITIKLNTARMQYKSPRDGLTYTLNLIDTPGHVDFSYEVSRSLAACEGALLVVDAAQGVEAQTMANVYLALENDLEIVPVLNKIDLPSAEPDRVAEEIEATIGLDCSDAIPASAKSGIGIEEILDAIIDRVPPPRQGTATEPVRALIYDSSFDPYRGVIVSFRVLDGALGVRDRVRFMASKSEYDVIELGVTTPQERKVERLSAGEVGYLAAGIKSVEDARVGDTITLAARGANQDGARTADTALDGYAEASPMVYCGLFPTEADQYELLRDSLGKLKLNDAALSFEPEASTAMGFGFRCGFLGLLHMEIVQERLEREYNVDLIVTAPSVIYRIVQPDGEELECSNPSRMPDGERRQEVLEPFVRLEIITPSEFNGQLMELAQQRRGNLLDLKFLTPTRTTIIYEMPLAEVIGDFFDQLKSRTRGYASMDFSPIGYRLSDLVRLDVRINEEVAPPLATVVHRESAYATGKALTRKLKDLIPREMFKVSIQACIGAKVVASSQISAMRKDVLAKCYGGDISRKKKLLQKQAKGKKRMKSVGRVSVPQEAFMAVLKLGDGEG